MTVDSRRSSAGVGPDVLLAGRYRLTRPVGSGAMGAVWLARDERLHRDVALKQVFRQDGATDAAAESRRAAVLREGRAAARVRHEHAVSVQDVTVDGGQAWLVMDHFPSESLGARLQRSGPLDVAEAAQVGATVAGALAAAHEAGVVHSDVKPGNILLRRDGDVRTARLTDFGIARMMSEAAGSAEDDIVGTPVYFSPEVARGYDPTPASDVFSLGSTVWTLVVGAPPFGSDEDTRALLRRVATAELPDAAELGALGPVLTELMARDPADRPGAAAAGELLAAVARGEHPSPSRGPGPAPDLTTGDGTGTGDGAGDDRPRSAVRLRDAEDAPRAATPVLTVALAIGVLVLLALLVGVVIATL